MTFSLASVKSAGKSRIISGIVLNQSLSCRIFAWFKMKIADKRKNGTEEKDPKKRCWIFRVIYETESREGRKASNNCISKIKANCRTSKSVVRREEIGNDERD